jgi:TonB family protein
LSSPIILRIFKDDKLQEVLQFDRDQLIFGNETDVQVMLADDQVAAIHCLIERRDSGYYLCDLGSATGTFKNGAAVLDEPISSGDQIKIGPFIVHFFVGVPKPTSPPMTKAPAAIPDAPVVAAKQAEASVENKKPTPSAKTTIPTPPKLPNTEKPEIKVKIPEKNKSNKKSSVKGYKPFEAGADADLRSRIQPTKGPCVEVIVSWQDRVLATYYFESGAKANIGADNEGDIFIPLGFINHTAPFLDLTGGCHIITPTAARAEFIGSHKIPTTGVIHLEQGELLCLSFDGGTVQVFVRYVPESKKPIVGPLLDFTSGELTGIVITLVIVAMTALYMSVYTPPPAEEKKEDEQVRLAQFIYNKPPPEVVKPVPIEKETVPVPPPPEKKKIVVKVSDQKREKETIGKQPSKPTVTDKPAAKAAEVRPMPTKLDRPKKFTSIKVGGAVKTGNTEGANLQTNKDVSKTGLMAAFGGGGTRKNLDQAASGAGDLIGMANQATGNAGFKDNRAGDDLGSKFKDTGAGGKGIATSGIAGIGTKGRSSGQNAYGNMGTGGKGRVAIDAGGTEAEFVGTIDREAVRRVVRSKLIEIKNCYERALNVDKSLEGKVVIRFIIEDQGRVRIASTKSSTLNNRAVEECVAARIRNAIFPEPPPGTVAEVDYPFVFGSQN